jgi:uncharacterized membrane protein HdeD (DUF308 family)
VRGFLALALGVSVLSWPHLTLAILILGFAVYAIGDGLFAITLAVSGAHGKERAWPTFLEGLLSLVAGLFVLFAPATASKLVFLCIGVWAIATGLLQLVEAPERRREGASQTLLAVSGIVRVLLGVMLLARPHAGLLALVWLVAVYAFTEGILMLGLAFGGKRRAPAMPQPV